MTPSTPPNDKLAQAYDKLLEIMKKAWQDTEDHALPPLRERLDQAVENLSALGEVTREEAEHVAEYVRRDLHEAADFLSESGHSLKDMVQFDLEFVERKFAEMFAQMADSTRMELDKLAERARQVGEWHTGEITGVGILQCKGCGEKLHFEKTGHIPPCPKCHGTRYRKVFA
ncbi:MAG: zinc ribbon-containing protein [Gammaproteobacteria bacterium]